MDMARDYPFCARKQVRNLNKALAGSQFAAGEELKTKIRGTGAS
jgi:hypothetical protein